MHVIIPALDEEASIGAVVAALPRELVSDVIVADNGSRDGTARAAAAAGARVVREPRRGYGAACLAGIAALDRPVDDDVVVFLDADGSDDPASLRALLAPLLAGQAELVLGSRVLGTQERGALPLHVRAGNAVAVALVHWLTGRRYTDLGPFRAIRYGALRRLGMTDRDFGWTIEMQLRAVRLGIPSVEIPVPYRRRQLGTSKISGTVVGSMRAGAKILWTVARHGF